jgi:hypothetical protein
MTDQKPNSRRTKILCAVAGLSLGVAGTCLAQYFFSEKHIADSSGTSVMATQPAATPAAQDSSTAQTTQARTGASAHYSASPSSSLAGTTIYMPSAGTESGATIAGHLVDTSRRAVDYPFSGVPMSEPPAEQEQSLPPQEVGRNGLLSNPSVDPPSSRGAAYSRVWQ